eukprot:305194-Rhodomonas_salina.3
MGCRALKTHLHTDGRDILLLVFTSQVSLHPGGLANPTIANQHNLEFRRTLRSSHSYHQPAGRFNALQTVISEMHHGVLQLDCRL